MIHNKNIPIDHLKFERILKKYGKLIIFANISKIIKKL